MLWQKEPGKRNAAYVDLFASQDKNALKLKFLNSKLDNTEPSVQKSYIESMVQHRKGNELLANDEFDKAIEKYNHSLCVAPSYSVLNANVMAYVSRSLCFMKLKMYKECLVDIEQAKRGVYTDVLMDNLNENKAECMRCIENGESTTNDIGLKLSYDPHETMPCLANVLSVAKDGNGNYKATAKEDIGVGKTIAVEKAFAVYSVRDHYSKCNICLKRNTNLVPCSKCTSAMFCHGECEENILHEGECGLKFSGIDELDGEVMKEVRIILMVIDMFSNASELMEFVQQNIQQESIDPSTTLTGPKLRYRDFLNLPFSRSSLNSDQFMTGVYFTYSLAMEVPKVRMYFNTRKRRRFLMHLLCLHCQITDENCTWSESTFEIDDEVNDVCLRGVIGLCDRFFGLSCAPNVMHFVHGDLSVFTTIRPVKKGEPLLTFMADYLLLESKATRQEAYREKFHSSCECARCQGMSATSAQELEITSDPDCHNVSSGLFATDNIQAAEERYVNFLNKHGHVPWCDALGKVVESYLYFLHDKMSGFAFSSDVMEAEFE